MIVEQGQGIVEWLQQSFAPMRIERTPNDPRSYAMKSQQGAMLVGFAGFDYEDPERPTRFGISRITWSIAIMKKNLRRTNAQDGVEELLDELGEAFAGHRIGEFIYYPRAGGFDDFDEATGVWTYLVELVGHRVRELEVPA